MCSKRPHALPNLRKGGGDEAAEVCNVLALVDEAMDEGETMRKLNENIPTRTRIETAVVRSLRTEIVHFHGWWDAHQMMQAFERAAVIAGGPLGQAVLGALDEVRDDVLGETIT